MGETYSGEGWVDVHVASAILGVSENTTRAMAREGLFEVRDVGIGSLPRYRIRRDSLIRWLESRSNGFGARSPVSPPPVRRDECFRCGTKGPGVASLCEACIRRDSTCLVCQERPKRKGCATCEECPAELATGSKPGRNSGVRYSDLPDEAKAKANARSKLHVYRKRGKVLRMPCEVCGETEHIHAHHEDYSKPLEVKWLCARHHREHHRKIRSTRNEAKTSHKID